jgi:hypothetical protein
MERPRVRYGTPNVDLIRSWLSRPAEEDGPFWAVNLMKYRPVADYGPGGGPAISGREADDRYTPHQALAGIGAVIALAADVDRQVAGAPAWDRIGIVRYPSRRAFLAMQQRDDFQRQHVHKEAGMESTIVMCCTPDGGTAPTPRTDDTVAVFGVEGVIVGDGRRWDRVRFDVVHDEDALATSGVTEEGVEETIAMTLKPILDSLTDTIREATEAGRLPR